MRFKIGICLALAGVKLFELLLRLGVSGIVQLKKRTHFLEETVRGIIATVRSEITYLLGEVPEWIGVLGCRAHERVLENLPSSTLLLISIFRKFKYTWRQ